MKARIVSLVVAFVAAAVSQAQIQINLTEPKFMLLMEATIQEHLKLTDVQKQKMDSVLAGMRHDDGHGRVTLTVSSPDQLEEAEAEMYGALDETQRKRLDELWVQKNGTMVLESADLQKKLAMTEDQVGKVNAALEEHKAKVMDLFSTLEPNEDGAIFLDSNQMDALQKGLKEKLDAVLTDEQKASLKAMMGEPFEFPKRDGGGRRP